MAVVLYHFQEEIHTAVRAWFPPLFAWLFQHGNLGVDVFFVLSGFVIAHSVARKAYNWSFLGRFVLRRIVRLDPPLWFTIALELVLIHVSLAFFPGLNTHIPGFREIASNMTYTQRFLGIREIIPVFWSLTYEVQFYVVTVCACVICTKLYLRLRETTQLHLRQLLVPAVGASIVYSVLIWVGVLPLPLRGLFLDRWFQFGLGVAAWGVVQGRLRFEAWTVLILLVLMILLVEKPDAYRLETTVITIATSSALVLVGLRKRMHRTLAGPTIQFLGHISYSLYLIHLSIGWRFIALVQRLSGNSMGVLLGSATLLGGILLSVLAAWVMYTIVERPAMKLARRITLPRALEVRSVAAVGGVAVEG